MFYAKVSSRLMRSTAIAVVLPLLVPVSAGAQQIQESDGLFNMGIGCNRRLHDASGRLFPDPEAWRALCEAHRDAGMAYVNNLRIMHEVLVYAGKGLPPPVRTDFVEYFSQNESIDGWSASHIDISASKTAARDGSKITDPVGWDRWMRKWQSGIHAVTKVSPVEWSIKARICADHLITYYDPDHFKGSWYGARIRNVGRATMEDDGYGHQYSWTPLLIGGSRGNPTVTKYDDRIKAITTCFDGVDGGGLHRTPLPRGSIAFFSSIGRNVRTERDHKPCPSGEVGAGIWFERQSINGIWVDGSGAPVANEADAWAETGRICRVGGVSTRMVRKECAATIAGKAVLGSFTNKLYFREVQDPADPLAILLVPAHHTPPHRILNSGEAHVGEVLSFGCNGSLADFVKPVITETRVEERDPRTCNDIYPKAHLRSVPPLIGVMRTFGTWDNRRDLVTESIDYPDDWPVDDFSVTWTEPWAVKENSCHGFGYWAERETRLVSCPSGMRGTKTENRDVRWDLKDYVDPSRPDELRHKVVEATGWRYQSNTCEYLSSSSGSSSSGGGGGGGDESVRAVDLDGDGSWDGVYDPTNPDHAGAKTGVVKDAGEAQSGYAPVRDDEGSGSSGGGCFLTTAIVDRRGEADDGPTLTALRAFRDGYMAAQPDGPELIREYYDVAPLILKAIPDDDPDWDWIGQQIDMTVAHLKEGNDEKGFLTYHAMVRILTEKWITLRPPQTN